MSEFDLVDLEMVYIHGHNRVVSLADAGDAEFTSWAAARMNVVGYGPWTAAEKVNFCQFLEDRSGALMRVTGLDLDCAHQWRPPIPKPGYFLGFIRPEVGVCLETPEGIWCVVFVTRLRDRRTGYATVGVRLQKKGWVWRQL